MAGLREGWYAMRMATTRKAGVIEDPYWLERGRDTVTVPTRHTGTATVLPMTDAEKRQVAKRKGQLPPLGFRA